MRTGSFSVVKFMYLLAVVMGIIAAPALASIDWTNANANNDFGDLDNWSPVPTSLHGQDCYINELSGENKAGISYALSGHPDDLYVGVVDANTGELLISGGDNTITNRLRVGRGHGTGIVTITDGTLNVPNTYTTFGDTGTAVLTMSGGTLNLDRITFGQKAGDSSTLNMSAGTININTSDATPASSSGSLRMGLGDANLNISGTAVIIAEKLYIAEGGRINMSGGTVRITGAEDAEPTFNFAEAAIGDMAGEIVFNGGHFLITGNYESLFEAAIGAGRIYTTTVARAVHAEYFPEEGLTKLVLVSSEKAYPAYPKDGQEDVPGNAVLKWIAGDYADTHDVYLGMVFDDVNDAGRGNDPNGILVSHNQAETTYNPPGVLEFGRSYYWRVDEFNDLHPNSPWKGNVWSFTTGHFVVVDDFEHYDAMSHHIWCAWLDGLGYGVPGTADYYAGNGTGSAVGDESTASFTEETIVKRGRQSMPLSYDNNKQGCAHYSEVELTLTSPRDWTQQEVAELSLWFTGSLSNDAEPLYVALSDSAGTSAVVVHDHPGAATVDIWTEWVIPLHMFADQGIDLTDVDRISIGLGTKGNTMIPGGSGKTYIDDIRLY